MGTWRAAHNNLGVAESRSLGQEPDHGSEGVRVLAQACCANGLTVWKEGGGTCRAWRVRPLGPRAELLPHRASRKPQLCICNTGAWWARDPRDTPPRQHPLNPQCGTHILVQGWVAVEHAQGLLHQHIGFHQGACGHTELTDLTVTPAGSLVGTGGVLPRLNTHGSAPCSWLPVGTLLVQSILR